MAIASATLFASPEVFINEIIDGPAPLIVTARDPAANALFLTESYPGIRPLLAGSTITSCIPLAIRLPPYLR